MGAYRGRRCWRALVNGRIRGHVYGYDDGTFRVSGVSMKDEVQGSLAVAKQSIFHRVVHEQWRLDP